MRRQDDKKKRQTTNDRNRATGNPDNKVIRLHSEYGGGNYFTLIIMAENQKLRKKNKILELKSLGTKWLGYNSRITQLRRQCLNCKTGKGKIEKQGAWREKRMENTKKNISNRGMG